MKSIYFLKGLATAIFLVIAFNTAFGQDKEIIFMFEKKEGRSIVRTNELKQKYVEFAVKGLVSQQDVDNFIAETKRKDGIISAEFGSVTADNVRQGIITMEEWTDTDFYKRVLLELGVTKVKIDGKEIATKNITKKETREANPKAVEHKK